MYIFIDSQKVRDACARVEDAAYAAGVADIKHRNCQEQYAAARNAMEKLLGDAENELKQAKQEQEAANV